MVVIARHKVDDAYMNDMRDRFDRKYNGLPSYVDGARRTPENLYLLAGEARSALAYGCLVEPESPRLSTALKLAADAYTGLFVAAASPSRPVTVRLGREYASYDSDSPVPDESTVEVGSWVNAFYLDVLMHDVESVEAVSAIPIELVRKSSTTFGQYLYLYMQALQSFGNGKADGLVDLILAAMKATDPKRPDIYDPDWTLFLHVPQLEVLIYLVTKDAKFGEALTKAVELHKKYWSKTKDRRRDYRGYISIELTALAALGKEQGLPFDVQSPYLPLHLARV